MQRLSQRCLLGPPGSSRVGRAPTRGARLTPRSWRHSSRRQCSSCQDGGGASHRTLRCLLEVRRTDRRPALEGRVPQYRPDSDAQGGGCASDRWRPGRAAGRQGPARPVDQPRCTRPPSGGGAAMARWSPARLPRLSRYGDRDANRVVLRAWNTRDLDENRSCLMGSVALHNPGCSWGLNPPVSSRLRAM